MNNMINYDWYVNTSKEQVYVKKDYESYKKFYDDLKIYDDKKEPS